MLGRHMCRGVNLGTARGPCRAGPSPINFVPDHAHVQLKGRVVGSPTGPGWMENYINRGPAFALVSILNYYSSTVPQQGIMHLLHDCWRGDVAVAQDYLCFQEQRPRISHLTQLPQTQEKLQEKNYHGLYAQLQSFKSLTSTVVKTHQGTHHHSLLPTFHLNSTKNSNPRIAPSKFQPFYPYIWLPSKNFNPFNLGNPYEGNFNLSPNGVFGRGALKVFNPHHQLSQCLLFLEQAVPVQHPQCLQQHK